MLKYPKVAFQFKSIKTKILIAFLLIAFIILFALTTIFTYIYTNVVIDKTIQSYTNTLGAISNNIDFLTESIENYSKLIISSRDTQTLLRTNYARNPLGELRDVSSVKGAFDNMVGRENIINSIFLIKYTHPDNQIYDIGNASNISFNNVITPYIAYKFSTGENIGLWTNVHSSKFKVMNREKNVFSYYRSMMDMNTGHIEGTLCINVNEEAVSSIFSKVAKNPTGKFMVVNENGIVMSSTNSSDILKDISDKPYFKQGIHTAQSGNLQYIDGKKTLVTAYYNEKLKWNIICFIPYSNLTANKTKVSMSLFFISLLVFFVTIVISVIVSAKITKPILSLADVLSSSVINREKDLQNLQIRIEKTSSDEVGVLQSSVNILLHKISELMLAVKQEQKLKREYELASINSHVKPHFLYNSINSICGLLYIKEQDTALLMLQALGEYYKFSLGKGRELIKISEEIKLTESYIIIQKNKYRDNLKYSIQIDDRINNYIIPKFTLQPLVENSFKHGFTDPEKQNYLEIEGSFESGQVILQVTDNGTLGNADAINNLLCESAEDNSLSFGLKSIHNRLKLYFEGDFFMHAEPVIPQGIKIVVTIPAKEAKQ